jgi:Divalent cation transporter
MVAVHVASVRAVVDRRIGDNWGGYNLVNVAGRCLFSKPIFIAKVFFDFQHWPVFVNVTELFILVPALMGLKGNLDMCLASRLSTQANLGRMDSAREIIHMVVGNISLVQVQATVAAFLVAWFAIGLGAILNGGLIFENVMLLLASSIFTATVSCFVLGKSIHKVD